MTNLSSRFEECPQFLLGFKDQFNNSLTSLLNEFQTFQCEIQQFDESLELERRKRDECLLELRRKYPTWSLPATLTLKDRADYPSNDSQVQDLFAAVEQLKNNFHSITLELTTIKHAIRNAEGERAKSSSTSSLKKSHFQARAEIADNKENESVKSSSEDDSSVELSFAPIRSGMQTRSTFGPSKTSSVGENGSFSSSPPTKFAFDQTGSAKRLSSMAEEKLELQTMNAQSSFETPNLSSAQLVSSLVEEAKTDTQKKDSDQTADEKKHQDDLLALLFPDKYERNAQNVADKNEDSDSDFFA